MGKASVKKISFKSMTGYGEATEECQLSDGRVVCLRVQCKSVNHRFVDVSLKMPSVYASHDISIQKIIRDNISRGRLEMFVQREVLGTTSELRLNENFVQKYIEQVSKAVVPGVLQEEVIRSSLSALWQRKELFDAEIADSDVSEAEERVLFGLIEKALSALIETRKREGEALAKEVTFQISALEDCVLKIEKVSEGSVKEVGEKLQQRVSEIIEGRIASDDLRLLTEIAYLADRTDIREELVRAKAHIAHFWDISDQGGRKLDFLLQELVRECNTIASKTSIAEVSALVVESKAILEKIKEQLQNVE